MQIFEMSIRGKTEDLRKHILCVSVSSNIVLFLFDSVFLMFSAE